MNKFFPSYIRVPVVFFAVLVGLEYLIDSGDKPAFVEYPMVSVFLIVFLFLLIAIEVTKSAIDKVTYALLTEEERQKLKEQEEKSIFDSDTFKGIAGTTVDIKDEGQLLLDHDYDGIKELDNNLPPWWIWMFYITIAFAAIYLVRFHILGHDNQTTEYNKEMEAARVAVEEYKKTAKDLVDASTVVLLTESSDLAAGKAIFDANCVACHRADGGGGIGPNLTDTNWILGGGIKNVFTTILEGGRDGKGMVSWKGTLKPSEMQQVASYVLSLQGTNPADAKAPEGDVWVEEGAEKAVDSTEVAAPVVDSTQVAE